MTVLGEGQWTPAPWINVVANPAFGFQVSESGAGYTWSRQQPGEQAHALVQRSGQRCAGRDDLRPGRGDRRAVGPDRAADPGGRLDLRRPARSGLQPIRAHVARHRAAPAPIRAGRGPGEDLPADDREPVRPVPAALGDGLRRVGAGRVAQRHERAVHRHRGRLPHGGAAGAERRGTSTSAIASRSPISGAARPHGPATGRRSWARTARSDHPALLERGSRPSGRVGAGLDPCAALQTRIELAPGGRAEVVFFLGQAATVDEARALSPAIATATSTSSCKAVTTQWDDIAGAVQVKTPDRSMDLMLNRWLLYQTLACRVWARSAFYQAGGAYGFRDQLQDVMALTVAARGARARAPPPRRRPAVRGGRRPALVASPLRPGRADPHLRRLRLAALRRHALPGGHGRRGVLDEVVPFLDGPVLAAGQHESYFEPTVSAERGTAVRALRPRARPESRRRRARPAPDRYGGLERRPEPRRPRGPWGERVARVVSAHDPLGVRAVGRCPRRACARRQRGAATSTS